MHGGEEESPEIIATLDKRYDEIMATAKKEYEYIPPSKSFPDGYNLYKRMAVDKDSYTLFIHYNSVEPTNNLAERAARKFKRKAAQVMCFRSQEGVDYFCDGLTMTETIKASLNKCINLYPRYLTRELRCNRLSCNISFSMAKAHQSAWELFLNRLGRE